MRLPRNFAKSRTAAVILIAGGLALCGGGGWLGASEAAFLAAAERAPGVVTAIESKRGSKGGRLYFPVVRFDPPGRAGSVTFREKTALWPSPFAVGDAVTVAYDPARPGDARVASFWTLWFLPVLMAAFGLLCIAAGGHTLARRT